MNILILTADSPFESKGGLGKSIYKTHVLLKDYNIYSFGNGLGGSKDNIIHYKLDADYIFDSILEMTPKLVNDILKILGDRAKDIDVIHCYDYMYTEIAMELKRILKKKLFHTFALSGSKQVGCLYEFFNYDENLINSAKTTIIKVIKKEKEITEKADKIIFVSHFYQRLFRKYDIDKYKVIHNGIDREHYSIPAVGNYIFPGRKDTKKVLYIGRIARMKNILNLLNTPIPDGIELLVAGNEFGGMKECIDILKNNPPKNVIFIGFISGDMKKYVLQNVDAIIVPSIHEPFGLVALEAIASKTLLLCSRSSGMAEFVHEDMCINCGLQVEEIHNSLLKFLSLTKEETEKIINTAYEKTKHLTWEKTAKLYKEIYEESKMVKRMNMSNFEIFDKPEGAQPNIFFVDKEKTMVLKCPNVLIKNVDEDYVVDYRVEVNKMIQHPDIYVPILYKDIVINEYKGYAMPYYEQSMRQFLDKLNTYPESKIETVLDNFIKLFKKMKSKGVVHGDLHPGNILISKDNNIALIDPVDTTYTNNLSKFDIGIKHGDYIYLYNMLTRLKLRFHKYLYFTDTYFVNIDLVHKLVGPNHDPDLGCFFSQAINKYIELTTNSSGLKWEYATEISNHRFYEQHPHRIAFSSIIYHALYPDNEIGLPKSLYIIPDTFRDELIKIADKNR